MKTKKELNEIKEEVKIGKRKLCELTNEELKKISGGYEPLSCSDVCPNGFNEPTEESCYDLNPSCPYLDVQKNRGWYRCTCMKCYEAGIDCVFVVQNPIIHEN